MIYDTEFIWVNKYEYSSINQYGMRYKREGQKRIQVAVLSSDCSDKEDLRRLILLGHRLDVPVRYDFNSEPQCAYIKIAAAEAVEGLK